MRIKENNIGSNKKEKDNNNSNYRYINQNINQDFNKINRISPFRQSELNKEKFIKIRNTKKEINKKKRNIKIDIREIIKEEEKREKEN